jgi:hypothetical protein
VLKIKKSKQSSSKPVQVKVKIPVTTVSITSILLIGLLSGIGYSGYLGVKSLWKFTHPQFNVSLDTFRALAYVAKGTEIPPLSLPTFPVDKVPDINTQTAYLDAVKEFKNEFRINYPKSGLLNISDNELINMGWAFCEAKDEAIAKDGKFVRGDIINAFQSKYVLRYPAMNGLGVYIDGIGQRAFDYLCRSN